VRLRGLIPRRTGEGDGHRREPPRGALPMLLASVADTMPARAGATI